MLYFYNRFETGQVIASIGCSVLIVEYHSRQQRRINATWHPIRCIFGLFSPPFFPSQTFPEVRPPQDGFTPLYKLGATYPRAQHNEGWWWWWAKVERMPPHDPECSRELTAKGN